MPKHYIRSFVVNGIENCLQVFLENVLRRYILNNVLGFQELFNNFYLSNENL
jgi:hypothetical protein